jgi:fructose-1,6-bisphosphatase/inositol monophosphatase family enzyme
VVIVQEAGGIVTTFENDSHTPYDPSIVAANPFIHKERTVIRLHRIFMKYSPKPDE